MAVAQVTLGSSSVTTTPLGLGANAVGGVNLFPNLKDETGIEIVQAALDNGIQLLDTAFVYGLGHSEELIGKATAAYKRDTFQIADKAAQDLSSGEMVVSNRPDFLKRSVDEALTRLNTDYIDVFYIHFPDADTPKAEAVGALHDLKVAGKISAVGVSNFSLAPIEEANQDGYVDVVENQFSLLHQDARADVMPYLAEHNISFVPFFPLASGLLTGKYTADTDLNFGEGDIRSGMDDFKQPRYSQILTAVDSLAPLAAAHKVSIAQLVLAYYIANPQVSVVIPGAKRPSQVEANAQALQVSLSEEEYAAIEKAFSAFAA